MRTVGLPKTRSECLPEIQLPPAETGGLSLTGCFCYQRANRAEPRRCPKTRENAQKLGTAMAEREGFEPSMGVWPILP